MTRYQLTIKVENLHIRSWYKRGKNKRPNSYCVVKVSGGSQSGRVLGQTEVISHQCNPEYTKITFVDANESEYLPIQVHVYDNTRGTRSVPNAAWDPEIAMANFEITEIYKSRGRTTMHTSVRDDTIKIHVSVEESIKGNDDGILELQIRGLELKNIEPGIFGLNRSDPYCEIARKNFDHTAGIVNWSVIYRSEYISTHLNPFWNSFTLSLEEICYNDINWPLKITVYDYNITNGKHLPIGEVLTTVYEVINHRAIRGNADRINAFRLHKINEEPDPDNIRGYLVIVKANIKI